MSIHSSVRARTPVSVLAFGLAVCVFGCRADGGESPPNGEPRAGQPDAGPPEPAAYGDWGDPFATLPAGEELREQVCGRGGDDLVRDVFCGDQPAEIRSLYDLQEALAIGPAAIPGISGIALAGHSTSLSLRSVSAINPRIIMFQANIAPASVSQLSPELVALSFNRGDQFAELVAFDRRAREFEFYVVRFEQACNADPDGCLPGDLLTEATETDWENVALYDEQALANTVLDCAPCHQPDGPDTPKLLRMQEFTAPWTHWLTDTTEGGRALLDDYVAAKGDESLAGISYAQIQSSPPGGLQLFVSARNAQPNVFDSAAIEREVRESAAREGGNQPFDNRIPGTSPTWRAAYERARRGEAIPAPYHDVKVTDADKLERMSAAYQAYRAGDLPREDLPDIRDVYPDDPSRLAAMGIGTEPGSSGEEVLIQACSMCHNHRLDPSVSRARFRADLQGLSRVEKDLAIARLSLPPNDVSAMPPARLRVLSPEARALAIEALRR